MFNDGCKRYGNDGNDRRNEKARIERSACKDIKYCVLISERQTEPCSVLDRIDAGNREELEVCIAGDSVIIAVNLTCCECKDDAECASTYNAQEDGDDLDHAFAPDVADNDDEDSNNCNEPV